MESEKERRRYLRIDDEVGLVVRQIDPDKYDVELEGFEDRRESVCFGNNFVLDQEKLTSIKSSLESSYPDIAEYLNVLNNRINMLTKLVLNREDNPEQAIQKVNISAQGLRFHSERSFISDDLVELRITLKPDNLCLLIIGSVVWSIEDPNVIDERKHAVAVDFSYINEADRAILVNHIHRKQSKKKSLEKNIAGASV